LDKPSYLVEAQVPVLLACALGEISGWVRLKLWESRQNLAVYLLKEARAEKSGLATGQGRKGPVLVGCQKPLRLISDPRGEAMSLSA
jgi:hypothetical protein